MEKERVCEIFSTWCMSAVTVIFQNFIILNDWPAWAQDKMCIQPWGYNKKSAGFMQGHQPYQINWSAPCATPLYAHPYTYTLTHWHHSHTEQFGVQYFVQRHFEWTGGARNQIRDHPIMIDDPFYHHHFHMPCGVSGGSHRKKQHKENFCCPKVNGELVPLLWSQDN